MKTIGIIGAMEEEIIFLKSMMEIVSAKNIVGTDFFMGKMHGKNIVLARSGIGKVNAAICTQILIDMYAVDYIINIGVAGAIFKELSIGDIVISNDLVQHDFDTSATGDPIGTIPRLKESFFKADEELVRIAENVGKEFIPNQNILVGRIATGDQFIADNESKSRIWRDFKAYCAEMEGGAIAHTCYLNKIPFVIIRTMSDKANNEASVNFSDYLELVIKNAGIMIEEIIKQI